MCKVKPFLWVLVSYFLGLAAPLISSHANAVEVDVAVVYDDETKDYYEKAIELKKDDPEAYYNMGIAFKMAYEFNDSASNFRKVLDINGAFVEEANHKQRQTPTKLFGGRPFWLFALWKKFSCSNDRPGNQLRKKRHKQGVIQKAMTWFRLMPIDIDRVAQRLESIERNPDRKNNIGGCRRPVHT